MSVDLNGGASLTIVLLCDFNVGMSCASDKTVRKLDFHEHPLTYVLRTTSFSCDACLKEDKDVSYRCTECPFWIHESCAMLPKTKRNNDHVHPLVLAYSLPTEDSMFQNYCDICSQSVHPSEWLYYCGDCKYYAHVVCAMSELSRSSWPTDQPIQEKDSFPVFFLGEGRERLVNQYEILKPSTMSNQSKRPSHLVQGKRIENAYNIHIWCKANALKISKAQCLRRSVVLVVGQH
ncbi:hypothetical protein RJ639_019188 [Escallonia herrerae]|uniref:DC1 domain-containing protein n=1 Tax=Escallonia herrerae TaxID=1293975 RepID=A0AA89AI47_9ASTE|nr:hypothetical protein RJ639_019188 [Escallonia herrerae]